MLLKSNHLSPEPSRVLRGCRFASPSLIRVVHGSTIEGDLPCWMQGVRVPCALSSTYTS
ncbi:hypothetical protein M405DRAFT_173 [Rhizopogon salebrosus TDB-379]|nr:hypothetical protein M405DRAFT_173 [Rhizopogon salebrosus TDB-379]